ncbi:MAG TPA: glycosyltransferase [Solirubrobacteraceae bacterium]|nr:glycosyltransferase [Solirubrobacteraceae bacterium]
MALRLTDPTPSATPVSAADDPAAYLRLVAGTAAIADRHRRHQARKQLLQAGLTAPATDPNAIARALVAVAQAAIELLEAEPREPGFLNVAGVALYELGALAPAERLLKAARALDPQLPELARNLTQLERRKRAGVRPLPAAAAALRPLAARAKKVAAAAKPATGLTLTLAMIVKDEEEHLGRCLEAAAPWVDQIVVVDTGSTDRTVEIALRHGAEVLHHPWSGDFAAARNVSFEAATCDWVMYLDADEVLVAGEGPKLRALLGHVWREAFFLVETNYTGSLEEGTAVTHNALRVFRNRPEYRFEGRMHEQIAQHLPSYLPERVELSDVRVDHYGYLGVVRDTKNKGARNIELLERQEAEQGPSAFLHYNLGSEYAAAGDRRAALDRFRKAWALLEGRNDLGRFGFVPSLAGRFVKALRVCGHADEAIARGDAILDRFPAFTDIVLEQAFAARDLGDLDRAAARFERCLELGDAPSAYSPTVGAGTHLARAGLADLRMRQGDDAAAEGLLREVLVSNPRFLAAVDPLARLLLRRGVTPGDVVSEIHALAAEGAAGVSFMLAVALYERGAAAVAEAELRQVLELQPGNDHARVALAEALLSQGRLSDAAAQADGVDALGPCGEAAARTRAFACLAGGDADGAQLASAPLATGDRAVYDAWRSLLAGAPAPALPATAAAPLLTALGALLHLEHYEAFGTLLPAWDQVALPARRRRELLAELYQRRGYLESAAEQWIAIVEHSGPDALALQALAEIAAARGFHEDAAVFAQEAGRLSASGAAALK